MYLARTFKVKQENMKQKIRSYKKERRSFYKLKNIFDEPLAISHEYSKQIYKLKIKNDENKNYNFTNSRYDFFTCKK